MALLINKEFGKKGFIGMYIAARLLEQKMNESRNQPAQSPLGSIELPIRTRSNQVRNRKPSKGKERSHAEGSRTGSKSKWIMSINNKLNQAYQDGAARSWNKVWIYRIPQHLQDAGDSKAYIPKTVSLGPYHHGKKQLRDMERHKWRTLHQTLYRTGQRIELYLDAVKELEEWARSYYEGTISLSSNEFVEMMVLDSCFMLEFFRGIVCGLPLLGYTSGDPIFANVVMIYRDMKMLENQIPICILEKLLSLQNGQRHQMGDATRLTLGFLNESTQFIPTDNFDLDLRGQHFLDTFWRNIVTGSHTDSVSDTDDRPQRVLHCVTELKEAGIKFERRETDRFWDIKFKNGVLQIPHVKIQDGTKSFFLNLIAYEQCKLNNSDCAGKITAYAIFMDSLINTAADVSYLHYKGIIEHWLGNDDDVAELFNGLCKEVSFKLGDSYLSKLTGDVNDHYDRKWNTMKASLTHNYFNTPWSTISFFAALFLLALTSLQTFFTVYPYYHSSS